MGAESLQPRAAGQLGAEGAEVAAWSRTSTGSRLGTGRVCTSRSEAELLFLRIPVFALKAFTGLGEAHPQEGR